MEISRGNAAAKRRLRLELAGAQSPSEVAKAGNLPGLRELGISPRSLEEELEAMLKQRNKKTQLPNRRRGLADRD
jgi:hypothetical protein